MPPEEKPTPQRDIIRAHLARITERWSELDEAVMLEMRAISPLGATQVTRYAPDAAGLDMAADYAENVNSTRNIYCCVNPVRADAKVGKGAHDGDIAAAFFCFADCDDAEAASNVRRFSGPAYTFAVTTGTVPHRRPHLYWELEDPCRNLDAWRDMQKRMAAHFGSDEKVVNPSRIMRVSGTVTHPPEHKRSRGYVSELVTLRTEYDDDRDSVAFDRLLRVFPPVQGATPVKGDGFQVDTGREAMDRSLAAASIAAGDHWHDNAVRLVASYVSRGLTDTEIHAISDQWTLPGYTVDDTRQEIQQAIDGARAKGWTPEPKSYADPGALSFDAPPAQDAAEQPSRLEWFDDIEAALGGSYVVKGVISEGSMSVVYGPSNSGKTFFALDLAFHVATGAPWRQRRVKGGGVLYLAAEGGQGVVNRISALRKEYGGVCDVPLALRRAGLDLLKSQADLQQIVDLASEVNARAPLRLIVIDTLSRVIAGGDENSAQDMTAFIRNVDAIRAATGAHLMIVHHTGKDTARGARGHSSLRAATDTEIEVANEDGQHAAMVTKQRDYQGGEDFGFTLRSIHLGTDPDGDDVTSCVVEPADADEFRAARAKTKGLGGNQKIIADAFDQLAEEGIGGLNPGGPGFPDPGRFWCIPMADLRRHAQGKMLGADTGKLFRQAWDALSDRRGLFCMTDNLVWRTDRRKN